MPCLENPCETCLEKVVCTYNLFKAAVDDGGGGAPGAPCLAMEIVGSCACRTGQRMLLVHTTIVKRERGGGAEVRRLVAGVSKAGVVGGGMKPGGVHGLDDGMGREGEDKPWQDGAKRGISASGRQGVRASGRQGVWAVAGMGAGGIGTARDGIRPWPFMCACVEV